MKKWWGFIQPLRTDEAGIILPLVIVFLALGLLLLSPALGHGFAGLQANRETNFRAQELHAADSGLEEAIYWLLHLRPGSEYTWDGSTSFVRNPYQLNDMDVYVAIEPLTGEDEGNTYKITSVAQRSDGTLSTVLAKAYVMPVITIAEGEDPYVIDDYFPGDLAVDGDLDLHTANAEIDGDVFVSGDLDLGEGSLIVGDVLVEGDVTLGQSAEIQCEVLCIEGNLNLGQSASTDPPTTLEAEVHFIGWKAGDPPFEISFANSASIIGDIFADGPLTINMDNPQTFIHGNIAAQGTLTISLASPGLEITGLLYVKDGDVSVHLQKKSAGIYDPDLGDPNPSTLYYDATYAYGQTGAVGDAVFPIGHDCGDFTGGEPCEWPEPEKECPVFPDPEGKVLSWEIS